MILDGDLRFFYDTLLPADIKIMSGTPDLVQDKGLQTQVIISLFTDGRALPSDKLPDIKTTRRGWWGDELLDIPIGNRRWLLERAKLNGNTLKLLEQYDTEALGWMLLDGVADSIEMVATRDPLNPNRVNMVGKIIKEDNKNVFFEYFLNWKNQISGTI